MEDVICQRCGCMNEYRTVINGPHIQAICIHCNRHIKFISKQSKTNNMALGQNNNAIFLNIADGKIIRRFQNPTKDSKERTLTKGPNTGKTVHEEHYSYVDGIITDIQTKDSDYGKSWLVTIEDNGEKCILQMDYSGGYSSAFLKALPNIDLSQKVKLSPKMTMEGDKKKTTLFINQHGTAAKHFYTKDNPNGLPQMVQQKVKGKLQWDDTAMMEFFENMVNTKILPQLKSYKAVAVEVVETTEEEAPF